MRRHDYIIWKERQNDFGREGIKVANYSTGTTSCSKKCYAVKEVAQMLGVSKSQVYEYVYRKKIPAKRLGKRILIPADYVEQFF